MIVEESLKDEGEEVVVGIGKDQVAILVEAEVKKDIHIVRVKIKKGKLNSLTPGSFNFLKHKIWRLVFNFHYVHIY